MRAANASRPGLGSSNRSSRATVVSRSSPACGAMLDLDDRARTQSHHLRRRALETDPHGKALRDPHPVERPLDVRYGARQIDPVRVEHTPADALHGSLDRRTTIDHRVSRRAVADGDATK